MRWRKRYYSIGQTRFDRGFIWWPTNLDGDVRWLERADWEEMYLKGRFWGYTWKKTRWLREK